MEFKSESEIDKSLIEDGLIANSKELGIKKVYGDKHANETTHAIIINRTTLDILNPKIYPKIKHLVSRDGVMLVKDVEEVVRFPGIQTTCFNQYKGTDEVTVTRNGVTLSAFRKLNN